MNNESTIYLEMFYMYLYVSLNFHHSMQVYFLSIDTIVHTSYHFAPSGWEFIHLYTNIFIRFSSFTGNLLF